MLCDAYDDMASFSIRNIKDVTHPDSMLDDPHMNGKILYEWKDILIS
jgi:hypothetical protein